MILRHKGRGVALAGGSWCCGSTDEAGVLVSILIKGTSWIEI